MRRGISSLLLSEQVAQQLIAVATISHQSLRARTVEIINGAIKAHMSGFAEEITLAADSVNLSWEEAYRLLALGKVPPGAAIRHHAPQISPSPVEVKIGSIDLSEVRNDWIEVITTLRHQPVRILLSELVEAHFEKLYDRYYRLDIEHLARKYDLTYEECFSRLADKQPPPYGEPEGAVWATQAACVHVEVVTSKSKEQNNA